jgi:Catalase-related immune-responsive
MDGVPAEIIKRQILHFYRADPQYGAGVAKALGISRRRRSPRSMNGGVPGHRSGRHPQYSSMTGPRRTLTVIRAR